MGDRVSVIILTWNGLEYTKKCLSSLRNLTTYNDYEVIIVDNGSTDDTLKYLDSLDWVTVIKNQENLGFVKGNNIGLAKTEDSDVIFLNNDIIITQSDWIDCLRKTAYDNDKKRHHRVQTGQ